MLVSVSIAIPATCKLLIVIKIELSKREILLTCRCISILVVDHQLRNNALLHLFLWTESTQVFLVPGYHPPFVTQGERVARMLIVFNLQ
jgi:hypothetical protein